MKNIIDAKPGSYFRIEERIYKSIEKPDNNCVGCCFFSPSQPCKAPSINCGNRIFSDVTFNLDTPELLDDKPKTNPNPIILVMTVLFWVAILIVIINL